MSLSIIRKILSAIVENNLKGYRIIPSRVIKYLVFSSILLVLSTTVVSVDLSHPNQAAITSFEIFKFYLPVALSFAIATIIIWEKRKTTHLLVITLSFLVVTVSVLALSSSETQKDLVDCSTTIGLLLTVVDRCIAPKATISNTNTKE